jgi:hypothetical protein
MLGSRSDRLPMIPATTRGDSWVTGSGWCRAVLPAGGAAPAIGQIRAAC